MNIHPTAIISPKARIASNTEIGPRVFIGDNVEIAEGCVIRDNAILEGHTIIGPNNFLATGVAIGAKPQDFAFEENVNSSVIVGSGNVFREYVTVHRGTSKGSSTSIGNNCYFMTGCHLGHNVQIGNHVLIENNCLLGGYVQIGNAAELGAGSAYHQFLQVGFLAKVGKNAACRKDIPPCVAVNDLSEISGINMSGIRKQGWSEAAIQEIQAAFHLIYQSRANISQALAIAETMTWQPEIRAFFDFIKNSSRGISNIRSHGKGPVIQDS
jgi:UDP-N-acetylglucosamine acyltransferase